MPRPTGSPGGATSARLRVYASAEAHSSIEKAVHDARARARVARPRCRRTTRFEMRIRRRSRPRSPPTAPPAAARSRSSRRSGRRRRPRSTRSPRSPTSPSASASGSTSTRPTPGAVAIVPGAPRAVRGLGAGRFDRHQPAQVAVHAARRLAAAHAPDGDAARRRSASSRSTCGRSTARRPVRDYNEYTPAARAALPGAQAVDPAALVRARGTAPPDPPPHRAGRSVRGLGRRRPGLGAARARPVLDGLLPPSAVRLDRRRRRAR